MPKGTAVLDWNISSFLEFKCRIDGEFFVCCLSVRFCPSSLARVLFVLELFVALGSAKFEYFTVIPDKLYSVTGIQRSRAKAASVHTHDVAVFLLFYVD